MATLNEVMKETADAIREKKGTTELIAPVDFATEIKGITAGCGGSGESGGSNWRYFDVSGLDSIDKAQLATLMLMIKVKGNLTLESMIGNGDAIVPYSLLAMMENQINIDSIKATALDANMRVIMAGMDQTIGDALITNPSYGLLTEITKEQFYTFE